jgi:hypothetical protein
MRRGIANTEATPQAIGPIAKQLQTAWKSSSHHITYVKKNKKTRKI